MRVVLPSRRDPRLRLAAVIISLQVLGQTVLGFKVSVAQILVSIGVCAAVDMGMSAWRQGAVVWPASGLLTGNSTAFILRAGHTQHGDWWSLNGIQFFIMASLIGILSKYLVRVDGRHVFNPSNLGLIATFLVVGSPAVFPQYLWWGPLQAPVLAALLVILGGAVWVLRPVRMIPMAVIFITLFAALVGARAATGACFAAIWHTGPICGAQYWVNICTSPELLIFVFFMMSDPRTSPGSTRGRILYAALTAVMAVALLAYQPTEFGIKVAILGSLTITCALVLGVRQVRARHQAPAGTAPGVAGRSLKPVVAAVALIAIAVPVGVAALTSDRQLLDLERGALSRPGIPSPQ
ncbi:MAG: hypothetical protein ACYDGR_09320 [Candidatus Dormibacteria bacterium]